MLHGIREGVVIVDPDGRLLLVNDEARRLIGLPPRTRSGAAVDEVVGAGRLADVLAGRAGGDDLLLVRGEHVIVANRTAVRRDGRDLGAIVTLRDRTELESLVRELDSVRGLTDAMRAQAHEFRNRLHTLAGLLALGHHDEAQSVHRRGHRRRRAAPPPALRADRRPADRGAAARQVGRRSRARRRARADRGHAPRARAGRRARGADDRRQPRRQRARRGARRRPSARRACACTSPTRPARCSSACATPAPACRPDARSGLRGRLQHQGRRRAAASACRSCVSSSSGAAAGSRSRTRPTATAARSSPPGCPRPSAAAGGGDVIRVLVVDDDFRVAQVHADFVGRMPGHARSSARRTRRRRRSTARPATGPTSSCSTSTCPTRAASRCCAACAPATSSRPT